ncbi:MAG: UDP-2,4-diacetamido-2,4,6-trideoxy-beta-L-altropyranose hydrolase [Rhodospirillales bacterium]|nr:UDP-2,4-diacetamido-2,4,6-trideoxy-beta-L-altropyranose hydrolase [Rhodospirillales bacterium]
MAPLALFRFDASPAIGSGHGVRSLALARGLADAGWKVAVAASPESFGIVDVPDWVARIVLDGDVGAEPGEIGAAIGTADLLVVDHYGRDSRFETACRSWVRRILVIDDLADRAHDCDLILDQTMGRKQEDYSPLVPQGCSMLLEPGYALLRPEFATGRAVSLARRSDVRLRRVMVSMGGTDPHDVAATVLAGLPEAGLPLDVDVVSGGREPSVALKSSAGRVCGTVRLLGQVTDMAASMAEADLAIGAGGVTSWERCCMGLPTLVITTAENQELIAARLAAAGAARVLGRHGDVTSAQVAVAIRDLAEAPQALRHMSEAAQIICDGKGIERTVAVLAEEVR